MEPIWIAFDKLEERIQAVGWGKPCLKKFLSVSSIIASISIHTVTKSTW